MLSWTSRPSAQLRMRLLPCILALLGCLATPLAARELTVERLDAELLVRPNGDLLVTEHIRASFVGSWNGLVRMLPVEYPGRHHTNYSLLLTVLGATDEAGHPLKTSLRRRGDLLEVRIWVPGAEDATRTVTLRYRVANALRFFEGYDELYWNAIGNERGSPVLAGSARVYLPPSVRGLRAQAWEGPAGSIERAAVDTAGGSYVEAHNARTLGFDEALTVDVAWDPGVVARPGWAKLAWWFLRSNWALVVPLLAFLFMFALWYRQGRDPRLRPIAPLYEPPEGLTPAEAGTLLDNSPDLRDITAMLVDLAVRGFLRIEEKSESHLGGLITSREYLFHLLKPREAWATLTPHETAFMSAIFYGGRDVVETSDLRNRVYEYLPGIKGAVYNQLVARGYYTRRPDRVLSTWIVAGIVAGLALGVGGTILGQRVLGQAPLPFVAGGVLTAAIMLAFARIMPARTQRGARALEGVLGFQDFLRRVEGDRLERVVKTPELFEKCLPYAMALGVESNWSKAFDGIYREPPSWYAGSRGGAFRASLFTVDLGHMCSTAGSAMTSAPRGSAGGSGFSGGGGGGGFSGGGFGGGGVGGF